ncbi:MAG: DEAD/DEAH box helicase [Clostridia bacterium]|nr:DEAD/DEAH box helicase [Clostridia bacterium]
MFDNLMLSKEVQKNLDLKGFTTPTEIQSKCIPLIVEGKDVVGRSQTGSGKTFAFGLPAIDKIDTEINGVQILIICPTRELALQVAEEIRKISSNKEGCKLVPVYGGADISRQITALKKAKIVVGTPGRLIDHIMRRTLKLDKLKMLVLDEADEMLNMGFKEDIDRILKSVPKNKQTVMFSATFSSEIKSISKNYMVNPVYVELGNALNTIDAISQSYIKTKRNAKKETLIKMFSQLKPKRTIIFCNTKRMADEINSFLNSNEITSIALHGDMRQSERKRVIGDIKAHKVSTLVATDVAARGIDITDVEYIINYDVPNDVEYYIHRIGRTARAGKSGYAITLVNTNEQFSKLMQYKNATRAKITEHELSDELSAEKPKSENAYGKSRNGFMSKPEKRKKLFFKKSYR